MLAGVSLAGVCSCLVWGGRSITGCGSLPRPVWRPFFHLGGCPSLPLPGGDAACAGGLCGCRRVRCFPLPPLFFAGVVGVCSGLPGGDPSSVVGGGVCGCGSPFCRVVVHRWLLSPVPGVVPFLPAPPPFVCFFFSQSLLCLRFPGRWRSSSPAGFVPACPGYLFLRPIGGCVVVVGSLFWLGVVGMGGLVSECPIGGSRGRRPCRRLARAVACLCGMGAWPCRCVAVPPVFLCSPWPAGVHSWGGEGRSAVSCS